MSYHSYLKIDKIWPKCIEIMLHSGRNSAHFGLKMLKMTKFDLEGEFLVAAYEVSLIPKDRWYYDQNVLR